MFSRREYLSLYIYIMSLATLKKKSQTKYRNMSVGSTEGGFSLNGSRRNHGYIGQTSLDRHIIGTTMKGDVPQGNGGCCGEYYAKMVQPSSIHNLNNTATMKSSVLSNKGFIRTHYRWIWRPQPFSVFKNDATMNNGNQSDYIHKISNKTIKDLDQCNVIEAKPSSNNSCLKSEKKPVCVITQDIIQTGVVADSQGSYVSKIKGCEINDKVFPKGTCGTPIV